MLSFPRESMPASPPPTPPAGAEEPGSLRRDRRLVGAAALSWSVIAAFISWRFRGMAVDDFFITFRYAQNLAAGAGFVFNPGEHVFGLSEPGIGLLLALLNRLTTVAIPALGTFTGAAALVGSAVLLLAEGCERGRRLEALVGGSLAITSSYLWVNQSAGVFVGLFCLLAASRWIGSRPLAAGTLAGLAVWFRPDMLAGVLVLVLLLCRERFQRQVAAAPPVANRGGAGRALLAAIVVIGLGAGLALLYFGRPLPTTLAAKHAMLAATGAGPVGFWQRALPLLERHFGAGAVWLLALGLLGQIPLALTFGRAGRLLVLIALALDLGYPLLGLPFFAWYIVPFALATCYGLAAVLVGLGRLLEVGLGALLSARHGAAARGLAACGALAIGAAVLSPLAAAEWRWFTVFNWFPQLAVYRQGAVWLATHSAPGDAVAYNEIGVLAFYSQRPVVDVLGLVTPDSIPYVERGDLVGAFLAHPTPFVWVHSRRGLGLLPELPWFRRAYRPVVRFDQDSRQWLTIYQRLPGSVLPAARPPGEGEATLRPAAPGDASWLNRASVRDGSSASRSGSRNGRGSTAVRASAAVPSGRMTTPSGADRRPNPSSR